MGVPAPRSVHARLIINGIYSGLYALTEQIDGRFARYNFSDGTGNIYKEVWPLDMNGQPHPEYFYINALKTNEDENPSVVLIQSFAKEIAASNSGSIQDVILKWMDVKEIISFAVVDRVIRNDDGPFHWYYIEENYWNHNYYWYEDPTKKRFHLIPWDLDNAFENLTSTINSVTCIADDWGEITNDGNPFPFGAYSFQQRSAASEKLTAGWVTFKSEYKQYLINFLEDPFSESQINSQLDKWTEQIRAATIEASQMYYDAISVYKWENSLTNLKAQLDVVREKFAKKIQ